MDSLLNTAKPQPAPARMLQSPLRQRVGQWLKDAMSLPRLPRVTIHLRFSQTQDNDPFFAELTRAFYAETQRRHPRLPWVRQWHLGVALCALPGSFEAYLAKIEPSGRRNCRKAERLGYRFARIAHNDYLADMTAIHRSTPVRQGPLPPELLQREVVPCHDPSSRTNMHDYPYFGVLQGGRLVAYAGCLVAGEALMIEQLFGHAEHQSDGVVPLLIVETARYALTHYPHVRYYIYERYFGAGETLRRFKRKFGFYPHRVTWVLE